MILNIGDTIGNKINMGTTLVDLTNERQTLVNDHINVEFLTVLSAREIQ